MILYFADKISELFNLSFLFFLLHHFLFWISCTCSGFSLGCGGINVTGRKQKIFGVFISVIERDSRIYDLTVFSFKWFSYKFRGPGLRFEIGICSKTGRIDWAIGLYFCGTYPDLKLFKNYLPQHQSRQTLPCWQRIRWSRFITHCTYKFN